MSPLPTLLPILVEGKFNSLAEPILHQAEALYRDISTVSDPYTSL
jgi:hypothetical protein